MSSIFFLSLADFQNINPLAIRATPAIAHPTGPARADYNIHEIKTIATTKIKIPTKNVIQPVACGDDFL